MLEALRYNLKHNRRGVIKAATAWFLFGAIIVVFIFWGMNPRMGGGQMAAEGGAAVIVNESTISLAQFGDAFERMRQDPRFEQLQSLGGDMGRQILQNQVLQQLIQVELLHQQSEKQGILTSDEEVRNAITSIPEFGEGGRFKRERYMGYLQATRKQPSEFEGEIRKQQSIRRTVMMFGSALRPLSKEVEMQKALSDKKAALQFASVSETALADAHKVTSEAVKTFVADAANETKMKDHYEAHKGDYNRPEEIKARHILIKAEAGNADAEAKALAKIEMLAKRAKTEDFAKLAKEFSEDPGSKENGGELGLFPRGRMVKPFEDAAFALSVNELSAPVKTDYGYHLIQVLEKKPAQTFSFDEMKEEIAEKLIAQESARKQMESLQQLVRAGDMGGVSKFLTENKIAWEDSGTFSIDADSVPKIGPSDEALRVAFSLTPERPLAKELIRQGGTSFVLRYKAPEAAKAKAEKPEDKPEIMAELVASRRGEDALGQWIRTLEKDAKISINPKLQPSAGSAN